MQGIRGAICARENNRGAIFEATQRLLREILKRNRLSVDDIVAAFFTMTPDLDADFPAYAARDLGWTAVPMLGAQESLVPGGQRRAIRVLLLCRMSGDPRHVYLGRAAAMRPDLTESGDVQAWDGAQDGQAEEGVGDAGLGRLLVVGLGLIGGSLALAARSRGLCAEVRGFDRSPVACDAATGGGLVDECGSNLEDELARADTVILATPVAEIVKLVSLCGDRLVPGALVTDVGSTKRSIVRAMDRLPPHVTAIGGHPLTGKTESGIESISKNLFEGAGWGLVRTARSDAAGLARVKRFVRRLGAHPFELSADVHDRTVAVTSHLPILLSAALVESVSVDGGGAPGQLTGPGFRSATRLATGDPDMTAQLLADNAAFVGEAIDEALERLADLRQVLAAGGESLRRRLVRARDLRAALLDD